MDNYSTGERRSPIRSRKGHARFAHRSRWVPRLLWLLGVAVLFSSTTGCATFQGVRDYIQYNDVTDDFVVGWRNYVWANKAWVAERHCHHGHPQLADFGEGFRAGYRDVAAGGDGCPPPLPPRKYWQWKYQSPEGQAKIAAWFSGYPYGAAAAEQQGAGNWREIPVSHVIQQMYSPEFRQGLNHCGGLSEFYDSEAPMLPNQFDRFDTGPGRREFPSGDFPGYQDSLMYAPPPTMWPLPPVPPERPGSHVAHPPNQPAQFFGHVDTNEQDSTRDVSGRYMPSAFVADQTSIHGYHP